MKHFTRLVPALVTGICTLFNSQGAWGQKQSIITSSRQMDERGGYGGRTGINAIPLASKVAARATTDDPCNLLPNPTFEDQKVAPLSGNRFNVFSPLSGNYDELLSWRSTNGSSPDYYATNAPLTGSSATGSSNPNSTAFPFGTVTPYNNNPALHNGMVGLYVDPLRNDVEYITPASGPLTLTPGAYYASFRAYRTSSDFNNYSPFATKLGMNFTNTNPVTNTLIKYGPREIATSIESQSYLQNSVWTLVAGTFSVTNTGQYFANIGNFSPNDYTGYDPSSINNNLAYYLIDELQLYKIPTAGQNTTAYPCPDQIARLTLGDGCAIPGATYRWRKQSGIGTFIVGTSLRLSVSVAETTSYTFTASLPDGSSYTTSVTVTVAVSPPPPEPELVVTQIYGCGDAQVMYTLTNRDPAYSYTMQGDGMCQPTTTSLPRTSSTPGTIVPFPFRVKTGVPTVPSAEFTVTATNGGCSTSVTLTVDFTNCTGPAARSDAKASSAAFPNPANESLTLPAEATGAVLLNSQGREVQRADAAGKLDVRQLPSGLYNLQMQQNGKVINQHIEVKH